MSRIVFIYYKNFDGRHLISLIFKSKCYKSTLAKYSWMDLLFDKNRNTEKEKKRRIICKEEKRKKTVAWICYYIN